MFKLSRFCIVFSVVCFIVALSIVPAFAIQPLDYFDYITDITPLEDGSSAVDVSFDPSILLGGFYIRDVSASKNYGFYKGSSTNFSFTSGHQYQFLYRPFQDGFKTLILSDLPYGTPVNVHLYGFTSNFGTLSSSSSTVVTYYKGSTTLQTTTAANLGTFTNKVFQFQLNYPEGADSFNFLSDITLGTATSSGTTSIGVSSLSFTFNIKQAYLDQVNSGRTNALLSAIENKLEDNGQTLDSILNSQQQTNNKLDGVIDKQEQTNDKLDNVVDQQEQTNDKLDHITNSEVTPERPSGSDSFDDLNDAETSLRDDAQSALDEFLELNDVTHEGIEPYLTSLFAVSYIFELLSDLPFFNVLLGVSLCLGLTGTILGISNTLIRSGGKGKD